MEILLNSSRLDRSDCFAAASLTVRSQACGCFKIIKESNERKIVVVGEAKCGSGAEIAVREYAGGTIVG